MWFNFRRCHTRRLCSFRETNRRRLPPAPEPWPCPRPPRSQFQRFRPLFPNASTLAHHHLVQGRRTRTNQKRRRSQGDPGEGLLGILGCSTRQLCLECPSLRSPLFPFPRRRGRDRSCRSFSRATLLCFVAGPPGCRRRSTPSVTPARIRPLVLKPRLRPRRGGGRCR